jgi:hypothetical protein
MVGIILERGDSNLYIHCTLNEFGGRCDRIVVRFTTTYAITKVVGSNPTQT